MVQLRAFFSDDLCSCETPLNDENVFLCIGPIFPQKIAFTLVNENKELGQ